MRFAEQIVVVTGAAHGIGAATARRLVAAGARVVLVDRDEAATAALVEEPGGSATARVMDVADPRAWQELAADLDGASVSAVVHCAYLLIRKPAEEQEVADVRRQLAVDLEPMFHSVAALAPALRRGRGCMVNVSSIHAHQGFAGHPVYAAAKGGMLALPRQLAVDLGPDVRVDAVVPGSIRTRIWDTIDDDGLHDAAAATVLGRLGSAEEVAGVIAFLASPDAAYVTGTQVVVDGGQLIKGGAW